MTKSRPCKRPSPAGSATASSITGWNSMASRWRSRDVDMPGLDRDCASAAAPKRLHIKTYGCQMNVYDSERMADLLAPLGYVASDTAEGADLVVLNTCHIREKATEKVYSELGRLKAMKARARAAGGQMLLAVAGCVAQAEGAEIMARQSAVDVVVGPQSYHRLPELIARAHRAARR